VFIPQTEGAIGLIRWKTKGNTLLHKILRALGPLGGDDHPLFSSRVLSQFGHGRPLLFDKNSLSLGWNIGKTQLYVKKKEYKI